MSRFPHSPGYKDRGSTATSREAAEGVAAKAPAIRDRILNVMVRGPMTAEQIAQALSIHWMIVRARMSELRSAGRVVPTGEKGDGALGGKVIVWRRTTDAERAEFEARQS